MFKGRSKHNLDIKGRLAIPSRFKEVLEQKGDDVLIVTNHDDCLWAYSQDVWQAIEDKAAKLPQYNHDAINYLRYFISGAVECQLKNGRITLPPDLREIAGLDKEVVLVGELIKFEIWAREKWEEEFRRSRKNYLEASKSLSEFGI